MVDEHVIMCACVCFFLDSMDHIFAKREATNLMEKQKYDTHTPTCPHGTLVDIDWSYNKHLLGGGVQQNALILHRLTRGQGRRLWPVPKGETIQSGERRIDDGNPDLDPTKLTRVLDVLTACPT